MADLDFAALVDAFNAGDLDTVLASAAPDVEYRNNRAGLLATDRETWRKIMEQVLVVLPDRRIELGAVLTGDGRLAATARYTATFAHPATFGDTTFAAGEAFEMDYCFVLDVADGLIRRWRDYADPVR